MNKELLDRGYIPCKGLLEPSVARVIYKTLLLQQWRGEHAQPSSPGSVWQA